jgi:hypothetical protein
MKRRLRTPITSSGSDLAFVWKNKHASSQVTFFFLPDLKFGIRGKFDKNKRSVGSLPITITEAPQILVAFGSSGNKNTGLL